MSETSTEPTAPNAAPPADGATPPAPATPETPPAAPSAPAESNPWENPEAARAEIERLRRENAAARVNAKTAAATEAKTELAQSLGKILGLVKEDATPEQLAQQLTAQQQATAAAQRELAIHRAAAAAGADPARLLDSRSFLDTVTGLDPTDSAGIGAAIQAALTSNPQYRAAQAAQAGGADFTAGGSGSARTFTRSQIADPAFFQANKSAILDAAANGRITDA